MRPAVENWRDGLGLGGVLIAAAMSWFGPAGLHGGLLLALIAFVADWRAWRGALRDPLFLALLACLAWAVLRWLVAHREGGIPPADQLEGLRDWTLLLLFPMVAWWLRGDTRRMHLIWLIALIAMLLALLSAMDVETLEDIAGGSRYGFHLKKPIALALYVTTLAMGLLLLAPRCWGQLPGWRRWLRIGLWCLALALLALAFLAAQARGALLSAVLVWPAVLAVRYRGYLRRPRAWIALVLVAGMVLGLAATYAERFWQRFQDEPEAVAALVSGDFRGAPSTSLGFRLRLWAFGFDTWRERPWMGWGPGATETLVAATGDPQLNNEKGMPFEHLHNTYLELLLAFGLIGAVPGAILLWLMVRAVWRDWRHGDLAEDHALWLLGSLAFTGLVAVTDFRSQHYDWRFFWLLLAGTAYAITMRHNAARRG